MAYKIRILIKYSVGAVYISTREKQRQDKAFLVFNSPRFLKTVYLYKILYALITTSVPTTIMQMENEKKIVIIDIFVWVRTNNVIKITDCYSTFQKIRPRPILSCFSVWCIISIYMCEQSLGPSKHVNGLANAIASNIHTPKTLSKRFNFQKPQT